MTGDTAGSSLVRDLRRAGVTGPVVSDGDDGYDHLRRVWNGYFDRRPGAIVRATSTDDVVATVSVAVATGLPLAIRGGGHSHPGLSTCDDGIVLDFSLLRGVTLDDGRQRAVAQAGAVLDDLDGATVPLGLVVPAGVVSHTGIAGLTLGGGMGYNSRRYGLTIDHLESVTLVLADGSRVTASETSLPDLFWAVRGGGGNFGVATQFTYRPRPLGTVVTTRVTYPTSTAPDVLAALAAFAEGSPPDEVSTAFTINASTVSIRHLDFTAGATLGSPAAAVTSLGGRACEEWATTTFAELQHASDHVLRHYRRYYSKGGFFGSLTGDLVGALVDAVAAAPTPDSDVYVLQLGGAVRDVPDDATAYTGRDADYYWVLAAVWDDPVDDERCLAWGRHWAAALADRSMSGNYVNEQGDVTPEVARQAYGDQTYARLAAVKAAYDPGNVFRLNQNIVPSPAPG